MLTFIVQPCFFETLFCPIASLLELNKRNTRVKKYLAHVVVILSATVLSAQGSPSFAADAKLTVPTSPSVPFGGAVKQSEASSGGNQASEQVQPLKEKHSGIALTLAGGGARGAAHIGVLKVLEAEGIRPDFIAGSSIGAMIGGLYAAGVPVKEIERLALSGELKKAYFPNNRKLQTALYFGPYFLARGLLIHPQIGLYSGESIAKFVAKHLPQGVTKLEDMPIPFAAAAVDLTTTKSVWLSKGSIADAIRASNSAPGFYRPVKVGEQVLVDGGVRTNLPTEIAEAQGAPAVVAVRLQAYLEKVDQKQYDTIMDYGDRVSSIFLSEIENKASDKANVLIEPKVAWMHMSSFDREKLKGAIEAGEIAARKALPKIRALQSEHVAATTAF